jgi:DNA-binding NarL/FixJ family response regulator
MSIEVLLVDEDRDVLDLVQTFLQQEDDLNVTGEPDPQEALQRAIDEEYDIVVSDYKMPHLNGVELCAELREQNEYVPFVLFSGREPGDMQPDAEDAGISGIVQKGSGTEQYSDLADQIRKAV